MNRAVAARLAQLEAALRHQRAARQLREESAMFELPTSPAERRWLYRELLTAPSRKPVPELAGKGPAEMAEVFRVMVRHDPHQGARGALRRVSALSPEGLARWRDAVGGVLRRLNGNGTESGR